MLVLFTKPRKICFKTFVIYDLKQVVLTNFRNSIITFRIIFKVLHMYLCDL